MLLTILLTFMGTSLLFLLLGWLACWRITNHLRGNHYATAVVVEHVLLPLMGHRAEPETPEPTPPDEEAGSVA